MFSFLLQLLFFFSFPQLIFYTRVFFNFEISNDSRPQPSIITKIYTMSAEEVKPQEPVATAEPVVAGTKRKETEPAVPVANDTEETSEKKEQEAESATESKPKEKETVAEPEESKEVAEPATEEPPKKKAKSKKTKGKAKSRYADIQGDDDDDDDDDDQDDENIENYDELKVCFVLFFVFIVVATNCG